MSLATERERGLLVCRCRQPCPQVVVLFNVWTLTDVHECGHCWRPILEWAP